MSLFIPEKYYAGLSASFIVTRKIMGCCRIFPYAAHAWIIISVHFNEKNCSHGNFFHHFPRLFTPRLSIYLSFFLKLPLFFFIFAITKKMSLKKVWYCYCCCCCRGKTKGKIVRSLTRFKTKKNKKTKKQKNQKNNLISNEKKLDTQNETQ